MSERRTVLSAIRHTNMRFFKHQMAIVESPHIGEGTHVWAYSHILPGARIGCDCNICDHTFIENDVILGDRVTIKCGVQIWDGVSVEDDVFIGPNATFTNDPFPRSKQRPERFARTLIKKGASIGANATILPGLIIGEGAMVGAGAVVTRNVPPHAILAGNPARITGYCDTVPAAPAHLQPEEPGAFPTAVRGVTFHRLPLVEDLRGLLSYAEFGRHVPFEIKRYFIVFGVSGKEVRGEHAHKTLHQFLVCAHGNCHVMVDDGKTRQEFSLDSPTVGIHLPPLVWGVHYKYSSDTILLVFASDYYNPNDYIRDYSEFLAIRTAHDAIA